MSFFLVRSAIFSEPPITQGFLSTEAGIPWGFIHGRLPGDRRHVRQFSERTGMAEAHDITRLLQRWSAGDPEAFDALVPIVYRQLKELAHARLHAERRGHTLNTTALVHEAYLRLVDIERVQWKDRNHFWSMAARAMRRILVDYARSRLALKRGGAMRPVTLEEEWMRSPATDPDRLLMLDDAMTRLEASHPRAARSLELHYFAGLTQQEVGEVLEISQPTVARDLRFARAWIAAMEEGAPPNSG